MDKTDIELLIYYLLLGLTCGSLTVQLLVIRHVLHEREVVRRGSIDIVVGWVVQARLVAEYARGLQHLALVIILALPLPIHALQHWNRTHFWWSFGIEAGGLALIPLLLLVTSWSAWRLARRVETYVAGLRAGAAPLME